MSFNLGRSAYKLSSLVIPQWMQHGESSSRRITCRKYTTPSRTRGHASGGRTPRNVYAGCVPAELSQYMVGSSTAEQQHSPPTLFPKSFVSPNIPHPRPPPPLREHGDTFCLSPPPSPPSLMALASPSHGKSTFPSSTNRSSPVSLIYS